MFKINPQVSHLLQLFLVFIHILALLFIYQLPLILFLISFGFILGYFIVCWKQVSNLQYPIIVYYKKENNWVLYSCNQGLEVTLLKSSINIYWLVILHFKAKENKLITLIIPKDALPKEQHRLLRMYLRTSSFENFE